MTPSCNIVSRSSRVAQCSASLPLATRYQWLWWAVNALPVGGTKPFNGPRFVPSESMRTATASPSETIASIVIRMSGNCASNHSTVWRVARGPFTLPGPESLNGIG